MPRTTAQTKYTDKGWNNIKIKIKELNNAYSAIGFFSDSEYREENITVATIAAVHEYGSPTNNIPERSFMRSIIDANKSEIKKVAEKLYNLVITEKISVKKAVATLGAFGEGLIKKSIIDLKTPPLKPETIRRKKSSNPLIDSGQMLGSVRHEEFFGKKIKR